MHRERLAWVVSLVVIAALAFRLPGSFAQREDDQAFLRTLSDIHRQVSVNYVDVVDEDRLRESAIAGMLFELDGYTEYVPPRLEKEFNRSMQGTFLGVGIFLNQLDNGPIEVVTPVDGSPAFLAGVQAGDVILKVNGIDIAGQRIPDVTSKIKGPAGTTVTLTLRRITGDTLDLTMPRAEYIVPSLKGFNRNADNTWNYLVPGQPKIAFVRITQFTGDTAKSLQPILAKLVGQNIDGLVLDLRGNPGGRLDQAIAIADIFIETGTIVTTRGRNRPEVVATASDADGALPKFPMAVLIDEGSASASEVLAGALADNRRAIVVGTRSFGKGSVQEVQPLPGKAGELKLTVAYYYLPSGRLVHRKKDATDWGVQPNIPVPVDPQVAAAVRQARTLSENFRKPSTLPAGPETRPTGPPDPPDTQLDQAVQTLRAMLMLSDKRGKGPATNPGR